MNNIVFVHGMFQNSKSWDKWVSYFKTQGYNCIAPSWPFHDGEPAALRANPPSMLGELELEDVIDHIEQLLYEYHNPIMIGHSVGGLIVQRMLQERKISTGVSICPVAPNAMIDFDWGFWKNSTIITNPLKGDEPVMMDAKTFHGAFANTLTEEQAAEEFQRTATHDSRNVLRDCMGKSGHIDLDEPHAPLLLIGAEKDEIIPASLVKKNFKAYTHEASVTSLKEFAGRSHYICNEPGWEEVAEYTAHWLQEHAPAFHPGFKNGRKGIPAPL